MEEASKRDLTGIRRRAPQLRVVCCWEISFRGTRTDGERDACRTYQESGVPLKLLLPPGRLLCHCATVDRQVANQFQASFSNCQESYLKKWSTDYLTNFKASKARPNSGTNKLNQCEGSCQWRGGSMVDQWRSGSRNGDEAAQLGLDRAGKAQLGSTVAGSWHHL